MDQDQLVQELVLPNKAALERSVEENTKCPQCQHSVRAHLENADGSSLGNDLDILVYIRCSAPACGWATRQWRPWNKQKPKEL